MLPRFELASVMSNVESRSALISCRVGDPSFSNTSHLVFINLIICFEGASSIVQWGSHSLLCALKSPKKIILSFMFPKISRYSRSET